MMSACSTRQDAEFISVSSSPVPAFLEPHYLSSLDADSSWRPRKKPTGFPKVSEDYLTQSCWNYFVMISKKIFFSKHSYPKICHVQRVFCLARGNSECTSGPSFHRSWQIAQLETDLWKRELLYFQTHQKKKTETSDMEKLPFSLSHRNTSADLPQQKEVVLAVGNKIKRRTQRTERRF
ncbi:uncharacterized protein LOC144579164 [Callithrix jacchus]